VKKAAYALSQNVKVIACIGELLEEKVARKTFDVCFKQMKAFWSNTLHINLQSIQTRIQALAGNNEFKHLQASKSSTFRGL
jgi:triosephosphate isomerase